MSFSEEELKLLKKMKELAQMRTKDECIAFEENVYNLSQNKSPEMLRVLLDLFDDDCPCYEVMYTLVHIVETYPTDMYISVLIESSLENFHRANQWLLILLYGIANHFSCRQNFVQRLVFLFHNAAIFFDKLRSKAPQYITEINELENKCSNYDNKKE